MGGIAFAQTQRTLKRLGIMALLLVGCGPLKGTRLQPLEPRTAEVGEELVVVLHADADANTAALSYSSDIEDLVTRKLHPTLTPYAGGEAIFRWMPLAADVGAHVVQFDADLGGAVASTRLNVTVVGGTGGPAFREPVGDGTTFDPTQTPCTEVDILVDDTVSTQVTIAQGDVWTDNGSINQDTPLGGRLRFCPSQDQQMQGTVFPFTLVATDESGARAEKRYTIVLGQLRTPPQMPQMPGTTCDKTPPVITTTPHADITTSGNLHIYATIDDPSGVYDAYVFWSTTDPGPNPDLTTMEPIEMSYLGGTSTSADFGATITNPVVNSMPGTTATIYYLIRSTDAADFVTGCTYNTAYAPATGDYSFVVKRSSTP
jgi:hypothetical protein